MTLHDGWWPHFQLAFLAPFSVGVNRVTKALSSPELGATPSTGTVGDSYDNALAEAINGLYKTELIRRRGPWRTVEQVELATLEWVWWWNNQRLHSELGYRTPAEVEAAYYADHNTLETATAALEKH